MTDRATSLAENRQGQMYLLAGVLGIAIAAAFFEILAWVVKGWLTFDRSYSLLILIFSLMMIRGRKHSILEIPPVPRILPGSLLTLLGCFFLIAGRLSNTLMVQGIAMVVVLLGLIWLILGTRHLKMLFVPVGYLLFMFYFVEELIGYFSHQLQLASAWIAASLMNVSGMPVFLHGNLIELPHITLEVAKVCNGVNHIVALVALSIPFAFLSNASLVKKWLLVFGAFFVGLFANGLRVALIGHWTKYHPGDDLHGPFDIFYVSFIFLFGLIFFALPIFVYGKWNKSKKTISNRIQTVKKQRKGATANSSKHWGAVAAALAILAATNAYIYIRTPVPVSPPGDLKQFPLQIGQWKGIDVKTPDWPAKHLHADIELRRIYRHSSGMEIGIYVGHYLMQVQEGKLVSSSHNWLYLQAAEVEVLRNGDSLMFLQGVARGLEDQTYSGDRRRFYFWYQIDNRIYLNRYETKLILFLNNLLHQRSNGTFILISLENAESLHLQNENELLDFIAGVHELLNEYV